MDICERLQRSHEWGYRDLTGAGFVNDNAPLDAVDEIQLLRASVGFCPDDDAALNYIEATYGDDARCTVACLFDVVRNADANAHPFALAAELRRQGFMVPRITLPDGTTEPEGPDDGAAD